MSSSALLLAPRYLLGAALISLCSFACDDSSTGSPDDDAGQGTPDAATGEDPTTPTETATEAPSDAGPTDTSTDVPNVDAGGSDETSGPGTDDGGTEMTSEQPDAAVPDSDAAAEPSDGGAIDSGSSSASDASDGPTSDAAADDAGSGGDFEGVEETALLDREPTEAYACEVSTEATLLEVPSGFDAALIGVDDTVWYARGEVPLGGGASPSLELSQLGLDATLGESVTLGSSEFDSYYDTQIAATPEGLLVFALQYGETGTELQLAATSLEGELSRSASPIEGLGGSVENYAVAVGTDEIALVFSRYTGNGAAMFYVTLDFDGTALSEPQLVRSNMDAINPGTITATSQGYLFSYVMGFQPSLMFVQPVDGAGDLGTAVPVATNLNGLSIAHSMLVRDSEVLLAWTDTGGSWDNSDLDRTTILSRLDLDGQRVAQDVRVQSPVTSQERVDPRLLERGEDIGLLWSEGSVIYICAGCMPDNHLRFVMLDGATLAPASETLTLTNPALQGGLISPAGWWRGDDLSVVAAVAYHTSGEGAAATITCEGQ